MPKESTVFSLITRAKSRPVSIERIISRILLIFEDLIKVPLFRCQKCGECILSHTAFVCCQRCPKRIRNGPCGGTGEGGTCEVYPERKCIWNLIYVQSRWLNRLNLLTRIEKIHNWELEKTSAWLNVIRKRIDPPVFFLRKKDHHDVQ
jgi:hypothetical protein